MSDPFHADYVDDEHEPCPKCNGDGYVDCYCGGDQCYCENQGEKPCGLCYGEGETTPERAAKYLKRQGEIHAAFRAAITKKESDNG